MGVLALTDIGIATLENYRHFHDVDARATALMMAGVEAGLRRATSAGVQALFVLQHGTVKGLDQSVADHSLAYQDTGERLAV